MATVVDEPVPKQGVFEKPTEFAPSPGQKKARRNESLLAAGFLAPQLVGLVVFMLGPLIFAVILAFSSWSGFGDRSFVGLANFQWVFTDPQILTSMRNTLWFTILQVPGLMVSAFIAAYLLQKVGRVKSIYRIFFFAPVVTSSVAVSAIWLWLLNPELSPFTSFLARFGITAPDWLQNPYTVIPAIALVSIWQGAWLPDGDVHGGPRERAESTDGGG